MRKVKVQPSGHEFGVDDGESVLAAALRQALVLPYGCRNGACGSCKGKLLEGQIDYGVYQKKALTDEEKAQGKALFCQAKPLGDVVIEARAIGAKPVPEATNTIGLSESSRRKNVPNGPSQRRMSRSFILLKT